jgi:PKD repeat protein
MEKGIVLGLLILIAGIGLWGQDSVIGYTFHAESGAYTPITGGTTVFGANKDENISDAISLPFTFHYSGVDYNTIKVSTNGFIAMGSATPSAAPDNDLASVSICPVLAPLWDDLKTNGTNGSIVYTTNGTIPNRQFIIQWSNMNWTYATADSANFQVVLFESRNSFQFIYGALSFVNTSASIGCNQSPGGTNNFISVTPSAEANISTTTANNAIDSSAYFPANTVYTFTPPLTSLFTSDYAFGEIPLSVHFWDISSPGTSSLTSWSWDFDNDGVIDSHEQNPTYTYTTAGSYTVSLTVGDGANTESRVINRYIAAGYTLLSEGLSAWYPLNGNAEDASGNGHDGDLVGGMVATTGHDGAINGGMYFDGVDDYVNLGAWSFAGEMTICAWVKSPGTSGGYQRFINMSNGGYDEIMFGIGDSPNQSHFGIGDYEMYYDNCIIPNHWEYVCATVNLSGVMKLYRNGVLLQQMAGQTPSSVIRYSQYLAKSPWSEDLLFTGSMDDVRIYHRELSQSEILMLYSSPDILVCNFAADVLFGNIPLTVHFTDESSLSQTPITSWSWDFDNDGVIDSHEQNPTYTYTTAGSYTVSLTVGDGANTESRVICSGSVC